MQKFHRNDIVSFQRTDGSVQVGTVYNLTDTCVMVTWQDGHGQKKAKKV